AAAEGLLASMRSSPPETPTVTWSVSTSAPARPGPLLSARSGRGAGVRWNCTRSASPGARRRTSSRTPSKQEAAGEWAVWSRDTAEPPAERGEDGLVGVLAAGAVHAAQHGRGDALGDQALH